jgi:hypothetical protein
MKLAILGFVLVTAAPARADETGLDIGTHVRWLGDPSGAALTTDPVAGVRITAAHQLGRISTGWRDIVAGAFARYVHAAGRGTLFAELETQLDQDLAGGGGRFELPLRWGVHAVGQGELGMVRTAVRISDSSGAMTPVDDHRWAPYAAASLGLEATVAANRSVRLAFALDLGYTLTVPVELAAVPGDRPDADRAIATVFGAIGALDTRGVTCALALRGAF